MLVVVTATGLGFAPSVTGSEISSTAKEADGYIIYTVVGATGDGQVQVKRSVGPINIPGTHYKTIRAFGTALQGTGKIVDEDDIERDGYTEYIRKTLEGVIVGKRLPYSDPVLVEIPGTVDCTTETVTSGGESGTIAVPAVVPRRNRRVWATVQIEIATAMPTAVDLAFDLGEISCSVTGTSASLKVGPGDTATVGTSTNSLSETGYVKSFGISANVRPFPGCYLITSSSNGSVNYIASRQPVANGNIISWDDTNSSVETKCRGKGATSPVGYKEAGVLKRRSRPVLTTLDGTIYYEVITWTI